MESPTPTRLIGVYDADGTVRGELTYFVKARFGAAHCALCDITHGALRERSDWRACRADLSIPFETYHRDDQPVAVRAAANGVTPVVVLESSGGFRVLLGPDELDACAGSPERLRAMIEAALVAS
ncbi:MAG: hypothetical protein Q8K63_07635, partial [Acidimicrobiales bacterium]|nr:hypothetical protein [Acidimicrobiales bacterium]